jgi:DNA-binding transcriptional regulator YdaS (Cro superfamily)
MALKMDVIEKISSCGTQQYIADYLGVRQSNVGAWLTSNKKNRVPIPPKRVKQIAELTGIPREEIRPDIFGK